MKIYKFKTKTKGSKMNNNTNLSFRNGRNPLFSSLEMSRRINSRRRLEQRIRDNQSLEYNSVNNRNTSTNYITDSAEKENNNSMNSNRNNIFSLNNLNIQNSDPSPSDALLKFNKLGKNRLSRYSTKKNEEKIEEEKQKIDKEESITSEIKDTVKCYICFDIITKPKMCPKCHRMACEKCLYNWFMVEHKKACGFCREKINFYEMISVPFMSTVVDFVEKVICEKDKNAEVSSVNHFPDFCGNHPKEQIYYYCLDCKRGYCRTCFVFFGEEKDKHINHNILQYDQYKNLNFSSLKFNEEKLNLCINKAKENIKRCLSYKEAYEFERYEVNKLITSLKKEFNRLIDDNIRKIEEQIKKLQKYVEDYQKYKKEITIYYSKLSRDKKANAYSPQKLTQELISKLVSITSKKFYSSKDIEKLGDLTKNVKFYTYQSKFGEFNHENMFLSKSLKMGDSPYELVIDNKQRTEVNINLCIPKNKITFGHNFSAFVFIRIKGSEVKTYELVEGKEDDNFFYYKTKIPWNTFGESKFKIKGVLYDYYFE